MNTQLKTGWARVLLLIGVAFAANVKAAVITTLSQNAPTDNVFASYDGAGTSGSIAWVDTGTGTTPLRQVAQTFTVGGDFVMTDLTLSITGLNNSMTAASSFTLSIYEAASKPASATSGTLISTQAGTVQVAKEDVPAYLDLQLGDAVNLSAGKYYTFVLKWDSAASYNSITFQKGSPFDDGFYWDSTNGTSWTSIATQSLVFYAEGTPAVPEPSVTAFLVPFAGLGIWWRLRARQFKS